jgi:hypothetical protein
MVFVDHNDQRLPRPAFFAAMDIQKGVELTWSYSANLGSTTQGKTDMPCCCGARTCKGYVPN